MKTYISDIIPRIQRFSQKLDNLTLLTNQHWVVIDDIDITKNVYIFRPNKELLISQNGKVEKAEWEYLGDNSLLIDRGEGSYLFKHGFFDENILALKIDGKEEYAFLVNETKFKKELNSSISVNEFLNEKYIKPTIHQPPKYTKRKIVKKKPLFGTVTEKYIVEFEDALEGEVFRENDKIEAYFIAKVNSTWVKSEVQYENINLCIIALHYYLKTGKIYKESLIGIFV